MQECLIQVGLKLAFAMQTLKQQTSLKKKAFICLSATVNHFANEVRYDV